MVFITEDTTLGKGNFGHNGGPPITSALSDGWIAVARGMRSHWLVGFGQPVKPGDPDKGSHSRAEAWIDLIMECRYEAGSVNNGGKKMRLERGQVIGATAWLAARWNWTPKTVRGFLDKLEEDGMIDRFAPGLSTETQTELNRTQLGTQKGKQAQIITICNYYLYQLEERRKGQATGQAKGQQGASKGPAEGNIYKDNKGTKEQGNKEESKGARTLLSADADPCPDPPKEKIPKTVRLECFHKFNDLAMRLGLSQARTLTPGRDKNLKARLTEHGIESWDVALANIERSAFLQGNNDRSWVANFDFVVQASSYCKLVDGTYGNGAHAKEGQTERIFRLCAEIEERMQHKEQKAIT